MKSRLRRSFDKEGTQKTESLTVVEGESRFRTRSEE